MVWKLIALALALAASPARADQAAAVHDEVVTNYYKSLFALGARSALDPALLGPHRAKLALDAAEQVMLALKRPAPPLDWPALAPRERARWFRLGGIAREDDLVASLAGALPEPGLLYELLASAPRLRSPGAAALIRGMENALPHEASVFRALKRAEWTPPSAAEIHALYFEPTDVAHFQDGAFAGKPRLFLFCRHDRSYPCLLAMKDKDDRPVRGTDGSLWTQPGLGLSGYGKPFNEHLGNTPQGVHLIDSVMPQADDPVSFGKFRRMILEFPAASPGEAEMMRLLPAATQGSLWWHESAIARDAGRGDLRIHGTGEHNDHPEVLFYPFIATIGCVAQREMKYGSVDYADQRLLLDRVMRAQGLAPEFANEPAIRALLYVIDIDDRKGPVKPADLARYGIR